MTDPTEFDLRVHARKTDAWKARIEKGDWDFEVNNRKKYTFNLPNGGLLEVLDFEIGKKEDDRLMRRMFLAELNGDVIGFLSLLIRPPKKGYEVGISETNVEALVKGLGVGGRLERVKQYVLQSIANERFSINNVGYDENKNWIEDELGVVKASEANREKMKERIVELLMNRQRWLAIYGREGKAGYKWIEGEMYQEFSKGGSLPDIGAEISENTADFRTEIGKL